MGRNWTISSLFDHHYDSEHDNVQLVLMQVIMVKRAGAVWKKLINKRIKRCLHHLGHRGRNPAGTDEVITLCSNATSTSYSKP